MEPLQTRYWSGVPRAFGQESAGLFGITPDQDLVWNNSELIRNPPDQVWSGVVWSNSEQSGITPDLALVWSNSEQSGGIPDSLEVRNWLLGGLPGRLWFGVIPN